MIASVLHGVESSEIEAAKSDIMKYLKKFR